ATFISDMSLPGMLHAAILRSSIPAGRIVKIDYSKAIGIPGVVRVLTGSEAASLTRPIPQHIDVSMSNGRPVLLRCLAVDRVRYVGEPICVLVATSVDVARSAMSRISVTYEPTAFVLDADRAMERESPRVYEDWPDNVLLSGTYHEGDIATAEAIADHH